MNSTASCSRSALPGRQNYCEDLRFWNPPSVREINKKMSHKGEVYLYDGKIEQTVCAVDDD